MFYVIRLTFRPGAGYAWGVAYAGADRPEARAAFDLIEPDEVWCIRKVLVQQQSARLAVLDSGGMAQPRGGKGFGWVTHAPTAAAVIKAHRRGAHYVGPRRTGPRRGSPDVPQAAREPRHGY
jgi:hypothetical protein